MNDSTRIEFQEVSVSATDFLHELRDPALLRQGTVPPGVAHEIKKQQMARLRENVRLLVAKREEFHRKMEAYIENLRALIRSIERSVSQDHRNGEDEASEGSGHATLVRCLGCESQRLFQELQVVFARESEESITVPTEVYVLDRSVLKKGLFRCDSCGNGRLVIRPL